MLAQTAAIMEVLHSVVGLVRSPVAITGEAGSGTVLTAEGVIITISGESGQRLELKALKNSVQYIRYQYPACCDRVCFGQSVHPLVLTLSITHTAMQVASRLWLVWGIIVPVKGATLTGAVKLGQVRGREVDQFTSSDLLHSTVVC